jgi:F0F1-type ATP synthase membrane subunit b/b'
MNATDRLSMLVRALDVRAQIEAAEREEAARSTIANLRSQFEREYREMASELRARGTAPKSTIEQYTDRRFEEVTRWNGWDRPAAGVAERKAA